MKTATMRRFGLALLALAVSAACLAQEATIRKNITQRFPELKAIDEVSKTGMPGVYEIRVNGTEVYYTDAQGDYLMVGSLYDTKQHRNLTEERVDKLTAIKVDTLPYKDAFTIVRGTGERKLVVFEDPNCGYCKRFERELQTVNNVTIHMFLYPILGPDSLEKSKAIWCAKDRGQVWQDWMVREVPIPNSVQMCDTNALKRNVELGRTYKINGTPTLIFVDGTRVPGAIDAKQIEKRLAEAKS
ncbi:DsbC family protein [Rhodoferax sp. GW822-FHT02A01]|uniref:DsbC family protein n=1 Tax=Rhodoferax sp. GW822-FHT02A01 TaxID=3141537 RepID=UPI00315D0867